MLSKRHNTPQFQKITRLIAAWFIFFALVVPALHRHGDSSRSAAIGSVEAFAAGHSHALSSPVLDKATHALSASADDDCALCQWFSVGFTPNIIWILLFATTASTLLVLSVRLLALCQRPLPRRGLRAPPVRFA